MASDLENGGVNQKDCAFISRKQADSLRKGFAVDGDVLLSHKGTIGRVAILRTDHDFVILTPQVTYYRVTAPQKLLNRFLYYAFQAPDFVRTMNGIAGAGSTRAYIGILKQQELPLAFPSISEQNRLAEQLDALAAETQRLQKIYEQKQATLAELKKSLLHQAFNGEL
jgi:type I restriction enzyme S subunit